MTKTSIDIDLKYLETIPPPSAMRVIDCMGVKFVSVDDLQVALELQSIDLDQPKYGMQHLDYPLDYNTTISVMRALVDALIKTLELVCTADEKDINKLK